MSTRLRLSSRPRPSHSEEGIDNGEEVDAEAFSMENDPWNGLSVGGDGISKHRACGVRQVFCAIRCVVPRVEGSGVSECGVCKLLLFEVAIPLTVFPCLGRLLPPR